MATGKIEGGTLPVNRGGTGASAAANARANLGIPEPYNMTEIYTGSLTTPIANGTVITLSDDATKYKMFVIQAYNGSPSWSTRMVIVDFPMQTLTHGIVGTGGNGVMGSLCVQRDSATTYLLVSSTFSTLYIAAIYGIK
jgi:hypothetical protein